MFEVWVYSFPVGDFVLAGSFTDRAEAYKLATYYNVSFQRFRVYHNGVRIPDFHLVA